MKGRRTSFRRRVPYIDNNFPSFKGTHRFITIFTTASHLSLSTEQLGTSPVTEHFTRNSSIIASFDSAAILHLHYSLMGYHFTAEK